MSLFSDSLHHEESSCTGSTSDPSGPCMYFCVSELNTQMLEWRTCFMLWANWGSWIFQWPVTVRVVFSGSLTQTILGSNFQLIRAIIFHYLYLSPKLQYFEHLSWFTQFHVWALKAAQTGLTKNRTGSSPPPLLFLTLIYPYFNTSGHSALLFSFSPCHIVPRIFLHPLFYPFFSHSLMCSSPPSVHSSVLHRQFTKSGILSLFIPQAFTTIYNTKPQR